MADSNITIVGLQAIGGVSQVVVSWAVDDPNAYGLPYLRFQKAEVRYSLSSDMASPVSLGYAITAMVDLPVPRGETRYYQVRAIDQSDQAGEWAAFASATEISGDVLLEEIGFFKNPNGLIHEWGNADTNASGIITPQLQRIVVPYIYGGFVIQSLDDDSVYACRNRALIGTSPITLQIEVMQATEGDTGPAGAPTTHNVLYFAIGR